jgi:adenosine deaminase
MISYSDYLRLLPKTELHCHFIAVMRPEMILEIADRNGVTLPTRDIDALLDSDNLADFLQLFVTANDVLRTPDDFAQVAYEGVADAVRDGNLRYREYYINSQNSREHLAYPDLVDGVIDGLRRAEREFGVGFRIINAINRSLSPEAAVEMVREMIAHPRAEVVGIGQDHLTLDGREAPGLWVDAYRLAEANGLKRTAHVAETMPADPGSVTIALEELHVDRIDHGYRAVDDPAVLAALVTSGVPVACTPISTLVLSGWAPEPGHRIAELIRAGANVTLSTDDAVFFRTDIGREYVDGLAGMGFGPDVAKRISLAGVEAAWCDDVQKARLLAEFRARHLALDALLDHATAP